MIAYEIEKYFSYVIARGRTCFYVIKWCLLFSCPTCWAWF